jgi:hypothetical protein
MSFGNTNDNVTTSYNNFVESAMSTAVKIQELAVRDTVLNVALIMIAPNRARDYYRVTEQLHAPTGIVVEKMEVEVEPEPDFTKTNSSQGIMEEEIRCFPNPQEMHVEMPE